MRTLKENYNKNIEILKENIKRGMSYDQCIKVINSLENQFISNNLYNEEEKDFINEMRKTSINHFCKCLNVEIIK